MNITPLNKTTRMLRTSCIAGTLLLLTVVTLVFVISMIAGLTHAWFTDSVSIDQNKLIVDIPEPGTESAWTDGDYEFGTSANQYYFEYEKGSSNDNGPTTENIFIGAKKTDVIGEISVEDNGDNLMVTFDITVSDVSMKTINLYIGLTPPTGEPSPANYGENREFDPPETAYEYVLNSVDSEDFNDIEDGDIIYIAGKLAVFDNR